MAASLADAVVTVHPFSRQPEGNEIVIGRVETGIFLALPPDAVELLDALSAGRTVGEAAELYREKYGETPDMAELLGLLAARGFVGGAAPGAAPEAEAQPPRARHHFAGIPQAVAARIFSPITVKLAWVVISLGILAMALEPGIIPRNTALYFARHRSLYALSVFFLGYVSIFFHEMAHLVAAKAVGVGARMSISHRLWILVAETDLTGLWSVPKRQRYLPLVAGPLLDTFSASLLLLVLFAHARAWIALPGAAAPLLEALVFLYLMHLLWQCFFFVRTDFYYVIASYFNCRNLLGDTGTFLRNQLARLGWATPQDQSHIPPEEARVIRAYAWVWLAGRLLAVGVLFWITVPLVTHYVRGLGKTFAAGFATDPYGFVDSLVLTALTLVPLFTGMGLWLNSLLRMRSKAHDPATHTA